MKLQSISFLGLLALTKVVTSEDEIDRNDVWYLCPTDAGDYCEDPSCDVFDGAHRAGYFCDTFPWYSGGEWPTEWNDEDEYYTCQEFHYGADNISGIATDCEQWSANEYSGDELEIGECSCFEFSDNDNYCDVWACYQTDDGYENLNFQICREDDFTYNGENFDVWCAGTGIEYELLRCFCYSPDPFGRFCQEWVCEQFDVFSDGSEKYSETEIYQCESNKPPKGSPYENDLNYQDSNFCWQWTGDINSDYQFEVTDCECRAANSLFYCSDWYCYEKGMDKYRDRDAFGVALGWSIAGTIVCIASTLLCSRICNPRNRTCVYFVIIFTFSLFSVICIFVGGFASWIIWFIIWIGLLQYFWVFRPTNSCFGWDEICGCDPFSLLGMGSEDEDAGEGGANKRKSYDVDGRVIKNNQNNRPLHVNQNSEDPHKNQPLNEGHHDYRM